MKCKLLTPGPVAVAPELLEYMKEHAFHHRSPEFLEIFEETRRLLKYLFQSHNEPLIIAASGTGGMECAARAAVSSGDEAIVLSGGKFGQRWVELCRVIGCRPIELAHEWGRAVDSECLAEALRDNKRVKAVFATHCETSTGVTNDIAKLGRIVRQSRALFVVDAISSVGTHAFRMDDWGVDLAIGASHKGLGLPPGLAFVGASDRALAMVADSKPTSLYFDFGRLLEAQLRNEAAFTLPAFLVAGAFYGMRQIERDGLERTWQRYDTKTAALRAGLTAMGLQLFNDKDFSRSLTAVLCPQGVEAGTLLRTLRDQFALQLAGGQAKLKGKIFRIGHMGDVTMADLMYLLSALEIALRQLGAGNVELGRSLQAFQSVHHQHLEGMLVDV